VLLLLLLLLLLATGVGTLLHGITSCWALAHLPVTSSGACHLPTRHGAQSPEQQLPPLTCKPCHLPHTLAICFQHMIVLPIGMPH
jgi:hypothetical protein